MATGAVPVITGEAPVGDGPSLADLARCVHCGLCLQNCPTYLATGLETESPRGRLYLMRARAEGRLSIKGNFLLHIDRCLVCRNCEAVCPSGVPFGRIMEAERASLLGRRPQGALERMVRRVVFRELLPHPGRLALAGRLLRWYQRSGLRALARRTQLRLLPAALLRMDSLLPDLDPPFVPAPSPLQPEGQPVARVAFFAGCVMPFLQPRTHAATVRVLQRNGCEVVFPAAQACCGALHTHSGERRGAQELARRNIDAFLAAGVDAVVVNAAGCGAALKEYGELLGDDPEYAEKARRFEAMVYDVNEYLATLDLRGPLGRLDLHVTYQDSCHLAHAQRITRQPRDLLRSIPGLRFTEMRAPDRCCGSAGVYNITQAALSQRLLESKVADIAETGAEVVVTANPGCMLQLEAGLREAGLTARVVHVVEVLDWAYQAAERGA